MLHSRQKKKPIENIENGKKEIFKLGSYSPGVWIGKVDDDKTPVDCEGPDWTEVDGGRAASIDCGGCCGGGGGCCGCGGGGEDDEFLV